MGHGSCQEPAPVWALHGLQFPSGHLLVFYFGVLHVLQSEYLLHYGTPPAAGQPALSWSSLLAVMEFLLWCLQNFTPSFFTDLGICRAGSLMFSHFSLTAAEQVFYPFLNLSSQRCHLWAQLGPAVGLSNMGQLLVSSYRAHPLPKPFPEHILLQ